MRRLPSSEHLPSWWQMLCHLYLGKGSFHMAEPQLSVRSARARDLAHRPVRRENRSVAEIVERALESYESRETGREPASAFYPRLSKDYGTDIDPDAVIRESRIIHAGPEL
jgi:hypothetical protein